MSVSVVARTSLLDEVVSELQQFIETDGLQAGDRLPADAELTAQLQVIRNVLREPFGQLAVMGLVSVKRAYRTTALGRIPINNLDQTVDLNP